jgi:hypothetical protein
MGGQPRPEGGGTASRAPAGLDTPRQDQAWLAWTGGLPRAPLPQGGPSVPIYTGFHFDDVARVGGRVVTALV